MANNNEDKKLDLIQQTLQEITSSKPIIVLKQRNFFWDSIILSVALFISGLSISRIIAELFSDDNSVACFTEFTNRYQYNFINSYCQKDLPKARYFPLIVLLQAASLVIPHYGWKVIFSAQFESFLSHAAKVEILREKNTGKYPHHNYTIVKYLQREFSDSKSILFFYILKLFLQIAVVIACYIINHHVFENITEMDITFKCKNDNQLFDNDTELFDNMTCVYPTKVVINFLVGIDYFLISIVSLMLIIGLCWLAFWNHSRTDNVTIAEFCYNSCIDPQYCYNLPKGCTIPIGCFQMRDDFNFLVASLHSGYRRVFRTILIGDIISEKFNDPNSPNNNNGNTKLLDYLTCKETKPLQVYYASLPELISPLCAAFSYGLSKPNLLALNIASGYHSYVYDINNSYQKKVVSVILGSHHESKIEIIKNRQQHIVVMSMKTLNKPKEAEEEFTEKLSRFIGEREKLNLIVVGPLDSEHKQSNVHQIVKMYSERKSFVNGAVMLVIKLIAVGKKNISQNFFDYNPNMPSWQEKKLRDYNVIQEGIAIQKIKEKCSFTYEVTVNYQESKCTFQLKSYIFEGNGNPPLAANGNPILAANGNPPLVANGNPPLAANGNPKLVANGNPPLAANGNPPLAANALAVEGENDQVKVDLPIQD